jgi:hypothetical protein
LEPEATGPAASTATGSHNRFANPPGIKDRRWSVGNTAQDTQQVLQQNSKSALGKAKMSADGLLITTRTKTYKQATKKRAR